MKIIDQHESRENAASSLDQVDQENECQKKNSEIQDVSNALMKEEFNTIHQVDVFEESDQISTIFHNDGFEEVDTSFSITQID